MPRLRWTRDGVRFTDHARNFTATAGEYEFDDEDRVEEYLDHRSDGWERVDEEVDDEGADSEDEEDLETYDRDELEAMEYGDLQTLAAEADTDAVDGRSSREDIVEELSDE